MGQCCDREARVSRRPRQRSKIPWADLVEIPVQFVELCFTLDFPDTHLGQLSKGIDEHIKTATIGPNGGYMFYKHSPLAKRFAERN